MREINQCRIQKLDEKDLERAVEALAINLNDYPGLLEGMNVELEHCDFTDGDAILSARIALAHLREDPQYYRKLKEAGL